MANQLPEDLLANILRRLAPRCLATSRCVCKPWRTIIDARRLLRVDLLPLSLAGIFINFHDLVLPEFFSRSTTSSVLSTSMDYLPFRWRFRHHCNGLLLLGYCPEIYVVNPATRQWVQLPPCPTPRMGTKYFVDNSYLVFDPTSSPHYEVFVIPHVRTFWLKSDDQLDPAIDGLEWPPSPFIMQVFSSRTKEWGERSFDREGDAIGTVADIKLDELSDVPRGAVYWRGALYVHCQNNFVMRISLSDGKYKVIKPPGDIELPNHRNLDLHLGKSKKGVYCAVDDLCQIYILDELNGKMEWVLWGCIGIGSKETDAPGPWILLDINYHEAPDEYDDDNNDEEEVILQQKFEWDSDNDDFVDSRSLNRRGLYDGGNYFTFLGFHPYKDIVFFTRTLRRGFACHINSGKVQDLGKIWPKHYRSATYQPFIEASFPYTPWMGEFP